MTSASLLAALAVDNLRATGDERLLGSALRHDLRLLVAHFIVPFFILFLFPFFDSGTHRANPEIL